MTKIWNVLPPDNDSGQTQLWLALATITIEIFYAGLNGPGEFRNALLKGILLTTLAALLELLKEKRPK